LEADLLLKVGAFISLCFGLSLSLELLSRWLGFVAVWLVGLVGLPSVPFSKLRLHEPYAFGIWLAFYKLPLRLLSFSLWLALCFLLLFWDCSRKGFG
jgi:hypothetical protein